MAAGTGSDLARSMDLMETARASILHVEVSHDDRLDRERCERELNAIGFTQALCHRAEWLDVTSASRTVFLCVRDTNGHARMGVGVDVHDTRVPPGHHVWQVHRLGSGPDRASVESALVAVAGLAREERHLLRLHVQAFSDNPEVLEEAAAVLRSLGFRRSPHPASYEHTVVVNLHPDVEDILASFHRTARQNIRVAARKGLTVRALTDPGCAGRLDDLSRQSFARTGGVYHPEPWDRIIGLANRRPDEARIVGLFRPDRTGYEALVAFALAYGHGDYVEYAAAGSARPPDLKAPLSYPVAWDLIQWARRTGARWFDFGGVTLGTSGDGKDRCGGISDFKRMFTTRVVRCSEEWIWEPSLIEARMVGLVKRGARALAHLSPRRLPALQTPSALWGERVR